MKNKFNKTLLFIFFVAAALRMPFFLESVSGVGPSSDNLSYFAQALHICGISHHESLYEYGNNDKILFVVLNAPVIGLTYKLTGNPALSVSLLPFLLSLFFVVFFYFFAFRIYGRQTAYWIGLLTACLPVLISQSCIFLSHTFLIYMMVVGAFYYFLYLDSKKLVYLITASIIMAMLGRIRAEGLGVFICFAILITTDAYNNRHKGIEFRKNLIVETTTLVAAFLVIFFFSWLLSNHFFEVSEGKYTRDVIGKILGKLTFKLNHMFNARTPGGFLESNKIDYLIENFHLVPLVVATLAYDVLKTIFILPVRLVPPLLFIFLGFLSGRANGEREAVSKIEKFFIYSPLVILAYPLLMFLSHSRYAFLFVPTIVLFIGKGLGRFEAILSGKFNAGRKIFTSRRLLTIVVAIYLALFYFVMTMPIFRDGIGNHGSKDLVAEYIEKNYGNKELSVMSMVHLPFNNNHTQLRFPVKISLLNGIWGYWQPVSLEETLETLSGRGETLLILSRNDVFGIQKRADYKLDYFSETFKMIAGYGDERLEMMRNMDSVDGENRSPDLFENFRILLEQEHKIPGLALETVIKVEESDDLVYVFRFAGS